MARRFFTIGTGGEVTLSAGVARTVLQLFAPADQDQDIRGFGVSFDGISGVAEPVAVELVKQSDAGTMSPCTPVKDDDALATIRSTAQKSATVEPTTTAIIREYNVHPQSGFERAYDAGEIVNRQGNRIGLRLNAPAGVNVRAFISVEE